MVSAKNSLMVCLPGQLRQILANLPSPSELYWLHVQQLTSGASEKQRRLHATPNQQKIMDSFYLATNGPEMLWLKTTMVTFHLSRLQGAWSSAGRPNACEACAGPSTYPTPFLDLLGFMPYPIWSLPKILPGQIPSSCSGHIGSYCACLSRGLIPAHRLLGPGRGANRSSLPMGGLREQRRVVPLVGQVAVSCGAWAAAASQLVRLNA